MPPHSITVLPRGEAADLLEAQGRETRRLPGCTDCHCCVLFLVGIVCVGALGAFGVKHGNTAVLDRLGHGRDMKGRLCGFDAGVEDFKYTYFTLALDSAPVGNSSDYWTPSTRSKLKVVCTNECPQANHTATTLPVPQRWTPKPACAADMYTPTNFCTWYGAETFKLVNYCIDPDVFDVSVPWQEWVQDIKAAAWHLIPVLPVAIMAGFIFLEVMEKCGACCVWSILFLMAAIPAGLGFLVFHNADNSSSSFEKQAKAIADLTPEHQKWVAYAFWAFSGLVLVLGCCFAGTVRGVAAVVRTTSTFLEEVPSQMLQPLLFGIVHLLVIAMWLIAFICVATLDAKEKDDVESCLAVGNIFCIKWDSNASTWFMLYMLLMLYWMMNFLHACSHFGTSFAMGAWYFTRPDSESGRKFLAEGGLSCCDFKLTLKAVGYGLRHHAGSLAFGALCISVAKVIRMLLWWVSKDTASAQNGAVQCCMRCTNCLAACMERFIQFVSEHAYVELALTGHGFCYSAKEAMAMAVRKPGLFTLVGRVVFVVKLIGIAVISCCATGVFALTLLWWEPAGMHSMTAPIVVAALGALTIAEVILHPFTAAARANLHCYCLDAATHAYGAEFTPQPMQRFIEDHEEHLSESSRSCCGRLCPCAI